MTSYIGLPEENIYAHTKKLNYIIDQINHYMSLNRQPITLLDFGCGNGSAVSKYLIRKGVEYYGVDIHEDSLNYAQQNFANQNAFFLDHLPEGILFDLIVYADVLEHLYRPLDTLHEHRKYLKENGLIIGSVPNGYGPFEMEKRFDQWFKISSFLISMINLKRQLTGKQPVTTTQNPLPYNFDSGHVRFYTKRSLSKLLDQAGFKIEDFKKGSFIGAPLSEWLFLHGKRITRWNAKIADIMPYWAVSTWYFIAKKT